MKRENLYLVGGALLASTALSTVAQAGVFTLRTSIATGTTVTATSRSLSAQIWGSTPSSTQTLGGAALVHRFNQPITSNFAFTIGITGAQFKNGGVSNGSVDLYPLTFVTFSGTGTASTLGANAGTLGCNIQAGTQTILITACSLSAFQSIGGFVISNVSFDNATGMATVGSTIALTGTLTISGTAFETTAAQNILTSRDSVSVSGAASATVGSVNVNANPPFTSMASSGNSAIIGTVSITVPGALAGDLSSAVTGANAVGASSITLKSGIIGDDAVSKITISTSVTPTQFSAGFVTFALATDQVVTGAGGNFNVIVDFNGTKEIEAAAAGTVDVTFVSAGGNGTTGNAIAPPSPTGLAAAAALTRSGLSIDVNGVQPGTAQGATTYTSLLRIANTGNFSGTVSIVVKNEATGATLGTYTSPSIPGGASLQVSSANIEAGAGITATASVLYRMTVSGAINGYVQHVNWNQNAGFFSDLSGRRTSVSGNN